MFSKVAYANRIHHLTHAPIDFLFTSSARDFIVEEIPLYAPSGSGEHLMIYMRKKDLSTYEAIKILSSMLGIKIANIGYAGLKDKYALTYQYLTLPRVINDVDTEWLLEKMAQRLADSNIKIIHSVPHANKMRIGHLKGNKFFMRLKKVSPLNAIKIKNALNELEVSGFANYFGFQRFGKNNDNFLQGKELVDGRFKQEMCEQDSANPARFDKKVISNKTMVKFLKSSYQSHLFNLWLISRVKLSRLVKSDLDSNILVKEFAHLGLGVGDIERMRKEPQFFCILSGDVGAHYPFGKLFVISDLSDELSAVSERFIARDISISGPLFGKKMFGAQGVALKLESKFCDTNIKDRGQRRYAWVYASDIEGSYKQEDAHFELSFSLPSGSYASVFLEALKNEEINLML